MYRIGLVGAQSFHSSEFAKIINNSGVIDARVTHIWSEEGHEERCAQIKEENGIEKICANYTDMIGEIDIAFIVTRNGNDHFEQIKPFVDANIPVWIDKPIALTIGDIVKICDYAESHNAMLMGGTTLKSCKSIKQLKSDIEKFERVDYLSLSYCSSVGSPTGGISFYSIHLAELAYMYFGSDIESLRACVNGDTVTVLLNYKNGTVANLIMTKGGYTMTGTAIWGNEGYISRVLDVNDCYDEELRYIIDVVEKRAEPRRRDEFIEPVKIMEAIEDALDADGALVMYEG